MEIPIKMDDMGVPPFSETSNIAKKKTAVKVDGLIANPPDLAVETVISGAMIFTKDIHGSWLEIRHGRSFPGGFLIEKLFGGMGNPFPK